MIQQHYSNLHIVFTNRRIQLGVSKTGSVRFLSKKVAKPIFFFEKNNRNRFEPAGFGSVRFFRGKNRLVRFFPVWLGFSVLAHFFPVLARFFSGYFFGSVRFFRFYKPKTDTEPVVFFKILIGLIGFFFRFDFFGYFFLGFLGFFLTPRYNKSIKAIIRPKRLLMIK